MRSVFAETYLLLLLQYPPPHSCQALIINVKQTFPVLSGS